MIFVDFFYKLKGDDDELNGEYEERNINRGSEKKDQLKLNAQQKKDAKTRAKKRLEEIEKQLVIARSNYLQLGGSLEDTLDNQLKSEQAKMKYCASFFYLLNFSSRL
jgi:hypothetical protein